jgi:recombinational DNA repair protein RecT
LEFGAGIYQRFNAELTSQVHLNPLGSMIIVVIGDCAALSKCCPKLLYFAALACAQLELPIQSPPSLHC